jgi:hypothetical protein
MIVPAKLQRTIFSGHPESSLIVQRRFPVASLAGGIVKQVVASNAPSPLDDVSVPARQAGKSTDESIVLAAGIPAATWKSEIRNA